MVEKLRNQRGHCTADHLKWVQFSEGGDPLLYNRGGKQVITITKSCVCKLCVG